MAIRKHTNPPALVLLAVGALIGYTASSVVIAVVFGGAL